MKRVVSASFPISSASLTLALVLSSVPAYAQPISQALPNMGQQITPLAPQGSRFEPLNPYLPYDPAFPCAFRWLARPAGRPRGHPRGESGSQNPADSDQRVQPCLQHLPRASTADANLDPCRLQ